MYIVVTYVLVTLLSTVLSSKLINMHKGNDRSGLLPLLGTGVGGGGPGRWTLVTFSQSTTEVEGGVQRGTRVWPPTWSRESKKRRVMVTRCLSYTLETAI